MNRKIYIDGGNGEVTLPSSKSDVHRILLAAALARTPSKVIIRGMSKDIEATMDCLCQLGASIQRIDEEMWKVQPIWEKRETRLHTQEPINLHCGECGATLRFLLPVAGAVLPEFTMSGEGRLPDRPIIELVTQMEKNGCSFSEPTLPFKVTGKLQSGKYILAGNVSSQYITGLMYALPLLEGDSEIRLTSPLESKGYIDMTMNTLEKFGVCIEEREFGYFIRGKQVFVSPPIIEAEGDWSNAAFFLAMGAIKGPVTCFGLAKDTKQGDAKIVELLERFGAKIDQSNGFTIQKGELRGIDIDASAVPDLVPILGVVASVSQGETRIYNAKRLRIKESNRLETVQEGLSRLGVSIEETDDGLRIQGERTKATNATNTSQVSGYGDHRIVMAMSVAALALEEEIVIEGTQAVEKSYPTFFEAWEQIGGRTDVI